MGELDHSAAALHRPAVALNSALAPAAVALQEDPAARRSLAPTASRRHRILRRRAAAAPSPPLHSVVAGVLSSNGGRSVAASSGPVPALLPPPFRIRGKNQSDRLQTRAATEPASPMATDADEAPLLSEEPLRPGSCSRELELREFRDRYVFRSLDGGGAFAVARADGSLRTLSPEEAASGSDCKVSRIYGVAGMIRMLAGSYVLIITSRKDAGSYQASTVYHVNSMKFLCCNEAIKHLTSEEKRDEAYFMSLLRIAETTCGLYYSYDRDLTLNLQRASKLVAGRVHKPLWKQADPRFVWNRNLLEELIETKLDEFITPLIQGSFQTEKFTLKDGPVRITLFSRRCNRRLGTRMWRRGANLEGATANFVETEQLVEYEGLTSSFIQVRGSIPLLWEQIVDLSYKPRPSIIEHEEMTKVVQRHFHDLSQRYGDTLVIDLTDKQGDEGNLSNAFAAEMEKFPDIRYVHFAFHHICGGGNFDNLQALYDEIKEAIQKQGGVDIFI
ncbi:hypothetical protein ACQ4PT_031787 [Festuca glaucescens]